MIYIKIILLLSFLKVGLVFVAFSGEFSIERINELTTHFEEYKLEEVFTSTHPIKSWKEWQDIKIASDYGKNLLDKKKIEQAIRFLLLAERHGDPDSFKTLCEFARSEKYQDKISQEIRAQLLKNFPKESRILHQIYQKNFAETVNRLSRQDSSIFSQLITIGKGYIVSWKNNKGKKTGISLQDILDKEHTFSPPQAIASSNEYLIPLLLQEKDKRE